jgi:ABC-type sugar transport system ATPase subunit
LRTAPSVLLLDEPTQGVDVGAKASIYELIIGAARAGTAVLVSSSDSTELAALCSRILVLRGGRVAAQIEPDSLTEARLIRESLGLTEAQTSTVLGAAQEESHV